MSKGIIIITLACYNFRMYLGLKRKELSECYNDVVVAASETIETRWAVCGFFFHSKEA